DDGVLVDELVAQRRALHEPGAVPEVGERLKVADRRKPEGLAPAVVADLAPRPQLELVADPQHARHPQARPQTAAGRSHAHTRSIASVHPRASSAFAGATRYCASTRPSRRGSAPPTREPSGRRKMACSP